MLAALAAMAPVTAVRGNNDSGAVGGAIAHTQVVDVDGVSSTSSTTLPSSTSIRRAGFGVVVAGHSHRRATTRDGVLWFNPGSAGPRRFKLPIALGRLTIEAGRARGEIVTLVSAP